MKPPRLGPLPLWAQYAAITLALIIGLALTPPGIFLRTHVYPDLRDMVALLAGERDAGTLRTRYLGADYQFMEYLAAYTPEDAIILMTGETAPSRLDRLRAKNQLWASYFLYPRRVLYLHQQEIPWYEKASWLVIDGEASVSWIAPERRKPVDPSEPRVVRFDMERYLADIREGRIAQRYRPPSRAGARPHGSAGRP